MKKTATVAWRRSQLDYVAHALDALAKVVDELPQDAGSAFVYIKDDETGEQLFRMTARGTRLLAYAMSAHRCGPACDRLYGICPMIAIAWLVEGCPQAGEDPHQTTVQGIRGER